MRIENKVDYAADKSTYKPAKSRLRLPGDWSFHIVNYTFLTLFAVIILYPLWYVLVSSVSSAYAVITNQVWLFPVEFHLDAYRAVFQHRLIMSGYMNSLIYMVFGTMVNVALLLTAAYPLSRKNFPGRNIFAVFFFITMFFSGGMIPNFVLINQLGLFNTRTALIVPFGFSAFNMIIVLSYFRNSLPEELFESAQMDGCNDIWFFFRIAIPLSTPVIAVVTLMHAIGHWNGFFRALLFVNDTALFPLQLVLRDILFVTQMSPDMLAMIDDARLADLINVMELLRFSVIVVGALPVLILYPFIQRYFVKGMMIGSIKG